jgi:hypothetical protein
MKNLFTAVAIALIAISVGAQEANPADKAIVKKESKKCTAEEKAKCTTEVKTKCEKTSKSCCAKKA